jgi:hypothetical protein
MWLCILLFLTPWATELCHASECTDACNSAHPNGIAVTFCGIDGVTYHTTSETLSGNEGACFLNCGVTALYEGPCGCPNECAQSSGQGQCSFGLCICSTGWGGIDCSLPTTGNTCGYHGKLIEAGDEKAVFPFSYCDCDDGWTGIDCTTQMMKDIDNAPWGTVFDGLPSPYSSEDKYNDDHPLFNIEALHIIRLEVALDDYISLITPENLYNKSYVQANFYYDNGKDQISMKNVGMKLKGQGSREEQKKGWSIKFNEYVSGQKLFDMKKIGLKPGISSSALFCLFLTFIKRFPF